MGRVKESADAAPGVSLWPGPWWSRTEGVLSSPSICTFPKRKYHVKYMWSTMWSTMLASRAGRIRLDSGHSKPPNPAGLWLCPPYSQDDSPTLLTGAGASLAALMGSVDVGSHWGASQPETECVREVRVSAGGTQDSLVLPLKQWKEARVPMVTIRRPEPQAPSTEGGSSVLCYIAWPRPGFLERQWFQSDQGRLYFQVDRD